METRARESRLPSDIDRSCNTVEYTVPLLDFNDTIVRIDLLLEDY